MSHTRPRREVTWSKVVKTGERTNLKREWKICVDSFCVRFTGSICEVELGYFGYLVVLR